MSNKIDFKIEDKEYSLRFGMSAVQITESKSIQHTLLHNGETLGIWDMFVVMIYAGLCNHADVKEINRPSWELATEIAEEISEDTELQTKIWETWDSSKPVKAMMDRLKSAISSADNKKKEKAPTTGTK